MRRRRCAAAVLAAVLLLALLAACDRSPNQPSGPAVASIVLSPDRATLVVGRTLALSAQALDALHLPVAASVSWRSTDTLLATVTGSGLVTGRRVGQVAVIAQVVGRSDTATLAIVNAPAAVRLTAPADSLRAGAVLQLAATVVDSADSPVELLPSWHTSDRRILTVSDWGLVASTGPAGSAGVTAAVEEATSPELRLRVVAGPPAALRAVAGELQAHVPGAPTEDMIAEVVDGWDNPVPGQRVDWTVLAGEGQLEAASTLTDGAGRARNRVSGRPAGEQVVVASSREVADTALFRIGTVATRGYTTFANAIFDSTGSIRVFHGVNRPSLEWRPDGDHIGASDFRLMREQWSADLVRIPVNQDFWLDGAALRDPAYRDNVDRAVRLALTAGLHVLLDLHWSDKGDLGRRPAGQQRMPDVNSLTFWRQVAEKYRGESHVFFDLYNEPHDVSWEIWRDGGTAPAFTASDGKVDSAFTAVGMQQLYDVVRSTGAENLVFVGGLDWGYDLTGVPAHRIAGHNIVYSTHPYQWKSDWQNRAFFLAATDPLFMGEFGSSNCATAPYADAIALADRHRASWAAWAWWSGAPEQICTFPTILAGWDGTPSVMGAVVKAALARYLPSGLVPTVVVADAAPADVATPVGEPRSP